jgi:putative Flp pilus-assembly TadE/G-like protein
VLRVLQHEDGQILPGLAVLLGVTLAVGVVFFQVGKASVLRSDAQNAADAAALAGVKEVRRQLQAQWAATGTTDITAIDQIAVAGQMERYAALNDGVLVNKAIDGVDVKAWTATQRELGKDAKRADSEQVKGTARARARLELVAGPVAGDGAGTSIGPVPGGGTPRIGDKEWKALAGRLTGNRPPAPTW